MLLSKDGQYLLCGGDRGVLSVWQVHNLKQLFTYPGCDAAIRSMAMTNDQRYPHHCSYDFNGALSFLNFISKEDVNRWHR